MRSRNMSSGSEPRESVQVVLERKPILRQPFRFRRRAVWVARRRKWFGMGAPRVPIHDVHFSRQQRLGVYSGEQSRFQRKHHDRVLPERMGTNVSTPRINAKVPTHTATVRRDMEEDGFKSDGRTISPSRRRVSESALLTPCGDHQTADAMSSTIWFHPTSWGKDCVVVATKNVTRR